MSNERGWEEHDDVCDDGHVMVWASASRLVCPVCVVRLEDKMRDEIADLRKQLEEARKEISGLHAANAHLENERQLLLLNGHDFLAARKERDEARAALAQEKEAREKAEHHADVYRDSKHHFQELWMARGKELQTIRAETVEECARKADSWADSQDRMAMLKEEDAPASASSHADCAIIGRSIARAIRALSSKAEPTRCCMEGDNGHEPECVALKTPGGGT